MHKAILAMLVLASTLSLSYAQEKMSPELLQQLKAEHQMNVELGLVDDSRPTFAKPPQHSIKGRANPQDWLSILVLKS